MNLLPGLSFNLGKTMRRGIATVAVYSEADANARHVRMADEAVLIGPAAARESYLVADRILAAARQNRRRAAHPGYGFLSENADFADACQPSGITFIGPPASAIRAMGSKSAAKQLMEKASVPLTPGYHGDRQEPAFLAEEAGAIGYPVLIKASAGGGGQGMRRVDKADDFSAALASCRREAASAFGNDHVLAEKYVLKPRHIEIQVSGDQQGHVVYLFERDCSVQRRHQKVLEEAPAPGMTPWRRHHRPGRRRRGRGGGLRQRRHGGFIANPDGCFYFMEMNTRLQEEHPVTEMITGLDLVEWQLRVASGEALPLRQEQLAIDGHALEARIDAELPDKGFLPSTGRLVHLAPPAASDHGRVDTGVQAQLGERRVRAAVVASGKRRHVFFAGRSWPLTLVDNVQVGSAGDEVEGSLKAPMPGKVIALLAAVGATVEKGTPLLVREAMKMEHTIAAPCRGVVKAFHYGPGEQVGDGADLVEFEARASAARALEGDAGPREVDPNSPAGEGRAEPTRGQS